MYSQNRLDAKKLQSKGIPPGRLYAKIKAGESIESPNGETVRTQFSLYGTCISTIFIYHISPVCVYIRFIRKKASVDKPLLEYMSKKLNTR